MKEVNYRLCSGYFFVISSVTLTPGVLSELLGQLLPHCPSVFLPTYMKDGFLLEDLKGVMSEFVFNVFKEKIRGIFLFRDDAEVKA